MSDFEFYIFFIFRPALFNPHYLSYNSSLYNLSTAGNSSRPSSIKSLTLNQTRTVVCVFNIYGAPFVSHSADDGRITLITVQACERAIVEARRM